MWHGEWTAADWALMIVAMLLFWTAVIVGVTLLVRSVGDSGRRSPEKDGQTGSSARAILDERYARGELSDEEYNARRETLAKR